MAQHVVSTTEGHVWLVEAESPDIAEETIIDEYEHDPSAVFYEGQLNEYLSDLDRDDVALLNP